MADSASTALVWTSYLSIYATHPLCSLHIFWTIVEFQPRIIDLPQCFISRHLRLRHIVFQNYIFFQRLSLDIFFCYVFEDKNNIYIKIITQILTDALWVAAMVYGTTSIVKGIFVRSYFCFCKHWTNPTTQTAQQRNKIVWRTPMTTAPQPRTTDANMSNEEWWEGRDCGAPATNHPRKYE